MSALKHAKNIRRQIDIKKEAKNPRLIPFPISALPEPSEALINDLYNCNGFNPEFQAGALLSIFSGAIGNRIKLQVKARWKEPAILWIPIVGDPSTLKTPTLDTYMQVVWAKQAEWNEQHEAALKQRQADIKAGLIDEEEPLPVLRELPMQDATIESVYRAHKHNPNGLLMYNDELSAWVKAMDQYKGGQRGRTTKMAIYLF